MSSSPAPRWLSRTTVLVGLALMLLVLPLGCSSGLVRDLMEVTEAVNLEVSEVNVGDVSAGLADDRVSHALPTPAASAAPASSSELRLGIQPRLALPAQVLTSEGRGLKRLRFEVPIDAYLATPEVLAPGERRPPDKALLVSQALDGMDIYLNGVWIAGLPKSNAQARYKWHRPLVAPLARRLLKPDGANVITIELTSWDARVQLGPLYIGGVEGANIVYELTDFIGSSLANASNLLCLLAGLFLLGAGVVSRGEGQVFASAGALTAVWALLFWLVLLPYVPASMLAWWQWAQYVCIGAVVCLLTQFMYAFIDERPSPRARGWMVATACAAPLLFPLCGPALRGWLAQYWLPLLMLFYLYATARLARYAVRTRKRPAFWLLALAILTQVMALHDHNVVAQLLPVHVPGPGWSLAHLLSTPILLSHLTMPLLLLVMGQGLLARIQSQVDRIRASNQLLQDTLAHRERELLVSYQRQRGMENEAAAQVERDRIYRELHDGIGSKLVTTLFSVRDRDINHQQLEARLLDALGDMRDIISVTAPVEDRCIQDILFSFAAGLDETLSSDSFHVEYDIADGREVVLLEDRSRQVIRIMEETVANMMKYANASRLSITARLNDHDVLELELADNGHGEPAGAPKRPASAALSGGRGLAGMRERARQMGGHYGFELTAEGARTCLRLPLGPAIPAPRADAFVITAAVLGEAPSEPALVNE